MQRTVTLNRVRASQCSRQSSRIIFTTMQLLGALLRAAAATSGEGPTRADGLTFYFARFKSYDLQAI